jgi:hypothetical protein
MASVRLSNKRDAGVGIRPGIPICIIAAIVLINSDIMNKGNQKKPRLRTGLTCDDCKFSGPRAMNDALDATSATEEDSCLETGTLFSSQDESRLIILRLFCGVDMPSVPRNL